MATSSTITPLFVILGLAGGATDAPVPPPEVAEAQLRAINHRFIDSGIDTNGALMDALTGADFLLTGHDGSWLGRAEFLAQMRQKSPLDGASYDDVRVRLFGPVAVVHAVFQPADQHGKATKLRTTDVYVWSGAVWQLVSVQNTPIKDNVAARSQTESAPTYVQWQGRNPAGDDLVVLRLLNENYVKAFREADVAWYDAHLAQDYVVISGDGSFHDRTRALADFAKPSYAMYIKTFPVDKVNIRRFGDVALIHAENAYELKDGRKGVSRYTDIWHKQSNQWRCIAAHITVHQAPTI
ncbi:MAG: nuclear transport factor 2 family protein [Burkholderiaceae bacterium]